MMIIVVVVTEEILSEIKNRGKKLIYVVMDLFFYSLTQVYSEKKILVVQIVIAFMLITKAFKLMFELHGIHLMTQIQKLMESRST